MSPRPILCGLFTLSALLLSPLRAQTHKVDAPEKITRALAVYEWTGDLDHPSAARLIPVSLFIYGHLEDAGVYLAQPIPFALQSGDVYSIERSGQTLATLDLDSAANILTLHSATADDTPLHAWYGYGHLLTPAAETKAAPPQASTKPPTIIDDAPPVLRHSNPTPKPSPQKANKQPGYVTPPTTPLNDDPNRPRLHRGIPAVADVTPQLTNLPPNLHQAIAVSDATNRAPQTFTHPWATSTDRTQTLRALEALARPHLATYITLNKLTPSPLPLANEQLSAYILSDGDLPTFLYTAETPLADGGPIYLTLVAQPDPSNHLHLALLSITDAAHLDRTPWLRPIDAADPDATHRASLLFELRAQSTRQFALYTLTNGTAQQTLLTTPIL